MKVSYGKSANHQQNLLFHSVRNVLSMKQYNLLPLFHGLVARMQSCILSPFCVFNTNCLAH